MREGGCGADIQDAGGRGSSRRFCNRNLLEFAVALRLRELELPAAVIAAVVHVLRSFEAAYNCFRGDDLWSASDATLVQLASDGLDATGLASAGSVVAGEVHRLGEACPVHVIDYRAIALRLLRYLAGSENLQSIGRNGLFTYNQMGHSVECGLRAAENLLGARHEIEAPNGFDLRL